MELFKIMGKIAIDNSEANSALKETASTAKGTADTIGKSNRTTQSSNKSTGSTWKTLKASVADYKSQGLSTSQAWAKATADMKANNNGLKSSADSAGNGMTSAFKKVGAAVAAYMTVDAIKNFGLGCIQAAADAQAMESQFSQVFGDLESKASGSLSKIADTSGISENRMKGSFTKIAAFAKTTGMDTEGALSLSERAMVAVADSAAFYDRSLEETTESLQSFLKGNYENDAALGLSCTEVTRNEAANKLYGKSFKDLSESQKQLTLLQMVEDANKASGALGQAARESDTWTNVTGNLKQAFTDFQATLGKHVLPVVVDLVKKFGGFVETATSKVDPAVQWLTDKFKSLKDWLSQVGNYAAQQFKPVLDNLKTAFDNVKEAIQPYIDKLKDYVSGGEGAEDASNLLKDAIDLLADAAEWVTEVLVDFTDWCSEHQGTIEAIAIVVGSLAAAWGLVNGAMKIWNAIGIISTAVTTAFGGAVAFLTSPVTLAVLAIGALIAIGVLLYKNWDTIKEKCGELWSNVKEKFSKLKESVVQSVTEMKDKAVEKYNELKNKAIEKFEELKNKASEKWNYLKDKVSSSASSAKDKAVSSWNTLKNKTASAFNAGKNNAVTAYNTLKSKVSSVASSVKDSVSSKWDSLKSKTSTAFSSAKDKASSAFSTLKSKVVEYASSAGSQAESKFNSMKSKISSAVDSAKSKATSAFSSMKSSISSNVSGALSTVQSKFDSIKSKISSVMESAKSAVSSAISNIRSKFNFSWSLPKLKLPHISISGKFSINPPSAPKFGISWYKKAMENAMILNSPTIFGYSAASGKFLGGGEAGSEVVAGTNTLMNMIQRAVGVENAGLADKLDKLISILAEYFPEIIVAMNRQIVLDSGAVVAELAPMMDTRLGIISTHKGRGN